MNESRGAGWNTWYCVMSLLFALLLIGVDGSIVLRVGRTADTQKLLFELGITLVVIVMLRIRPALFWHGWLALFIVLVGFGVVCFQQEAQGGWTLVTMAFALHVCAMAVCMGSTAIFWLRPIFWREKRVPEVPRE